MADKLYSHLSEDVDEQAETNQNLRQMGRLLRQFRGDTKSPYKIGRLYRTQNAL